MENLNERYFPDEEKITRHGFISHMEAYIKQLLKEPLSAKPDEYLEKYGVNYQKAQEMLLRPVDKGDPESAVMRKEKKIITGYDGKDKFQVKYLLPRKDYRKKMKKLFIQNFEKNIIEGLELNECDGGDAGISGATSAESSGQYVQPLFGKPIRKKTVYVTQEQVDRLSESVVMDTPHGDYGYDAPVFAKKGDPTMDHKNIMAKSWKK